MTVECEYNRIAIFVFFDEMGVADRCIDYYLNCLAENAKRIVIVSNGEITTDSKNIFEKYVSPDDLIVRENNGFDAWAWKIGMEHVGWSEIAKYDDVILCNDAVFGPIYPLEEMFEVMAQKEVDFWGMLLHREDEDFTSKNPHGYIPEHIQSYFTVYRNSLTRTEDFKNYWENLPPINNWHEAVALNETVITKYFVDRGYTCDTYIKLDEGDIIDSDLIIYQTEQLLREYRLPFVKCKQFCNNNLKMTDGSEIIKAFNYIKNNTDYDENLIWDKILRKYNQYDVLRTLANYFFLPDDIKIANTEGATETNSIALVMHLFFEDMFDKALDYAKNMPAGSDIFISTNTEEKIAKIKALFDGLENNVEIRIVSNIGRSESALLIGMKDVFQKYSIVCFWKEKKSPQTKPKTAAVSWANKIDSNLLCTGTFVENVISTFENNPRLGLLMVTPPSHSLLYGILGREWTKNFEHVVELKSKLDLNVPICYEKPPTAPLGGVFWCRTSALIKLFDYEWEYSDFPEEPLPADGTLLHAIERIYPFVAQDAGFYSAYLLNAKYAQLEFSNYYHYLRTINSILDSEGYEGVDFNSTMSRLHCDFDTQGSLKMHIRKYIKALPKKIFGKK